jgi:hypothetical protein
MRTWAVVALEREHALVDGERAPAGRHGGFEHGSASPGLEVGPVDNDHRTIIATEHLRRKRGIHSLVLAVEVTIAE